MPDPDAQPVQKLHLVGFTTDQTGLILSARRGARSGGYTLVVDEALVQAVEELRATQEEEAAAEGRADRPESRLPVSEIQARLRRGKSLKDVAKEAGVEPEWVERFAAPVFAERAEVISRVQGTFLKRARLGPSGVRIGDAVRRNLVERGVVMAPDEFADAWSTSQRPDGRWIVRFGFAYRGSHRTLKYEVRPNGDVMAGDPFTAQLSYVAPPKRAAARPKPAAPKEPEAKRAATVGSGFRPEQPAVKKKATSRPARERERAAAAMTKAAARRALEAERAASRKARERAQLQARREREARVEAQRREREARARAREAAAAARLAAAEQAERERRAAAEAAARQADRERARAARERAREQAAKKAAAKKAAAAKRSTKKEAAAKKGSPATTKKAATAKKGAAKKATTTKRATTTTKATTKKATSAKRTGAAAKKGTAPSSAASTAATTPRTPARTAAARKVVAQARAERARKAALEGRRSPAEPRPAARPGASAGRRPASSPTPSARPEARPSEPAPAPAPSRRPEAPPARPPRPSAPPRPDQRVAAPPPDGAVARPAAAVDLHGPEATRALFRAGLAQPAGEPEAARPTEEGANGQAARVRPPGFRRRRPLRAD